MSKKILTLDNVPVINKKIGKIDTIEKLKASTIYSIGDVVEVLGFHTKGDGSHHKRIAKAEDDGSGEQGQNGIWWCVVHSGEVNVSWFGAKGDGVTDSATAFKKALNVATIVKVPIGKYVVSESIYITKYNTQLVGSSSGEQVFSPNASVVCEIKPTSDFKDVSLMAIEGGLSPSYRSNIKIKNISLVFNTSQCENGIRLQKMAEFFLEDVTVKGFKHGVLALDTLIYNFNRVRFLNNEFGIKFLALTFSGQNNVKFDSCRFIANKQAVAQTDGHQFGHGFLFDNCEIEANGDDSYSLPCIALSLGLSTSDSYGVKFENCWIEGNKNSANVEITSIGTTNSKVIFRDNVMFGANCKSLVLKGTNKNISAYISNSSNYSSGGGIEISNGSVENVIEKSIFASTSLTNGSYVLYLSDVAENQMRVRDKFLISSSTGGAPTYVNKRASNPNSLEFTTGADFYFYCNKFYINNVAVGGVYSLDTPYYTLKMQEQGIYDDYVAYRDELHEYENSQTDDETMLLPVLHEPVIPESIKRFAEKHKLI